MGAFVIPAYQAASTLGEIVRELVEAGVAPVLVVDDGSTDDTAGEARRAGAIVLSHEGNQGKGAALQTALRWALGQGHRTLVTLDADGQHPAAEALRFFAFDSAPGSLLLGVRDLEAACAPLANQRSNRFSNLALSFFGGRRLQDTQCGLRRYPVAETLALGAKNRGFAFEADVVLRAARTGLPIVHTSCLVHYPKTRRTHFDSVRDPARIVWQVLRTVFRVPHYRPWRRLSRRLLLAAACVVVLCCVLHVAVRVATGVSPPEVRVERVRRDGHGSVRRVGSAMALKRQGVWEVFLSGSAARIGWAHAALLREEMLENEAILAASFASRVPFRPMRRLIFDLAAFRYRDLERSFSLERRQEIAASAAAFAPDPFEDLFPTYQRFVYLNALYDIALSFEHSPLVGCTTFTVAPSRGSRGPMLARAFDFEVDEVFDRQKAVFFVKETGQLPFASVAWPGLVGVVSGMNLEGLAVVVHGARAGPVATAGEPVVHALRRILGQARTSKEALAMLDSEPRLVSHLLIIQDAAGDAVAVERSVAQRSFARRLPELGVVTNHLEGPLATDAKNLRVQGTTSTNDRRARGEALLRAALPRLSAAQAVGWLRDRRAVDGSALPAGDRRAIDAHIATHGVVMETAARMLWVSQGPHLRGGYVGYDLTKILAAGALAVPDELREELPPEPIPFVGQASP